MFDWSEQEAELRKLKKKLADKRAAQDRRPLDWSSLFEVTPLAKILLGVMLAGALTLFFVYREDKGKPPPKTYPARGKVVVVPGNQSPGVGMIQFVPIGDAHITVIGEVSADGSFRLVTLSGKHRADGAPLGEYNVTVMPRSTQQFTLPLVAAKPVKISPDSSNLTVEVEKSKTRK